MLYLLVDWKNNDQFFLQKEMKKNGIEVNIVDIPNYTMKDREVKIRIIFLYLKYINLAYRAIKQSQKDDILICWNYTTSIALGYICRLLKAKRKILALNIIAHKKAKLPETIRKIIFSPVLKFHDYYITVNSDKYISDYCNRFNITKEKFFVLNDPIQSIKIGEYKYSDSYIFAGGEAQRDWDTLFRAAQELPDIRFVCIARKKYFNSKVIIPKNVELYFDTNKEIFYNYLTNSSIVVVTLKSDLPSGLIILLKAALLRKPIISTATPSTINYIKDKQHGLLINKNSKTDLINAIKLLHKNKELQEKYTKNLLKHLLTNHSPQKYAANLMNIIKKIDEIK